MSFVDRNLAQACQKYKKWGIKMDMAENVSKSFLLIMVAVTLVWCQPQVNITGTVTNALAQPIENAQVNLVGYNVSAVTDKDGRYLLAGQVPILTEHEESVSRVRIFNDRLFLKTERTEKVRIDIYNISGRRIIQLVNRTLKKGEYTFPYSFNKISSQMNILRIEKGGDIRTYKVLNLSNFQAIFPQPLVRKRTVSLASAKVPDSLADIKVTASGYIPETAPVKNWTSTIDVTLQAEIKPISIPKSMILFTQVSSATVENIDRYKANAIFWGHKPNDDITSDNAIQNWASGVGKHISNGLDYVGRGEFDWGWKWMIDFMQDPGSYWVKNLDGNNVLWGNGETYNGHQHCWQSHHGPEFLAWLKYQVDRLLVAPITHIMFDSQTSATRTLNWYGGDFSKHSIAGFRNYLAQKFTTEELKNMGVNNVNTFDFGVYIKNQGYNVNSYKQSVSDIQNTRPLCAEFVYYQRHRLNEVMEELLAYIDVLAPDVPVGATTSMMEPRGYIFSDRLDYLAGELSHTVGPADGVPFNPVSHYKAAEAVGKTLILFPYPSAWKTIRDRNNPRHARTWIAQAYAMGAIFSIPGNIWMNPGSWDPGWENYYDVYQFVRKNEKLLDNYGPVSNVGFVYPVLASIKGGMDGSDITQASTKNLIERNFSFDYLIFGDPGYPVSPTVDKLNQYDVLVTDGESGRLSPEQNQLLASASPDVILINDISVIINRVKGKIDVLIGNEGIQNSRISAFPRKSADENAPYVVHLINRKYNSTTDRSVTHNNVSIKISRGLFDKPVTSARFHLVDSNSKDVTLQIDGQGNVTVDIGTFDRCWGLVELSH